MLIIDKYYFWITQGALLLIFLLIIRIKRKRTFIFSSEYSFHFLILGATIVIWFVNRDYQLFCIPVAWTTITLLFFAIYLVGNFLFKKIIGGILNQVFLGIGLPISLYIIVFGSWEYSLFGILINLYFIIPLYLISWFLNKKLKTNYFDVLNLYGAIILFPYLVIVWTIWQVYKKKLILKISLLISPLIIISVGFFFSLRMKQIIQKINSSENKFKTTQSIIQNPLDNYLTELVLGSHWKYHTKICFYDGWRPPFHDPVLGFAQMILYPGKRFNNEMGMETQYYLYKNVFPDKPLKFDCKCAKNEVLF